ncbi:transmembrane protein DDB_G0292058-like isoform X2 [Dendrobium catenatum]|uniref:transmembrane protein DDB_G0292058-like isoform X2 n=1 Tax=Dendrobium catenatum TaxID=906689 RepID=UPI0009F1969B|nr:transmembrane protein DDB_G0292058-like isoform X2 [Dendrobium catenatum]
MGLTKWSREVMVFLLCIFVLVILKEVEAYRDEKPGRILHFESGRILVENGNISESVLTRRTERVDPLDDLKRYKGGFNITNKHYWGSVIFTGKFGYFIGAAWLVGGLIYAAILIISSLCFSKQGRYERKRPNSFNKVYNWPLLLAISLTFLAIIASGVALGASSMFHSRAKTIKNIVVNATNNASGTIYTVTEAVENLQNATEFSQNVQGSSNIVSTSKKLNDDTRRIERKADRIMRWVGKGLNILNAVTVITISLNLVAILALLGVLRLPRIFRMLIILCWLLIILLWVYFGLYYFFGKFAGDVCLALDEYKQNPEQSTLSSILPCNDRGSAAKVLHDVSGRVYDLIQKVNSNITSLKSSISELEYICNPFSGPPEYTYQPQNCSSDTITVGQVPQRTMRARRTTVEAAGLGNSFLLMFMAHSKTIQNLCRISLIHIQ